MFYNAKRKRINISDTYIDCITFGGGEKNLVIVPGVGEGFVSFKGVAIPFSLMYRKFAKDYKVYVFNRRNILPKKFTTKDMALDIIKCLNILGVDKASILGVSLGGMIAQEIAIERPSLVDKLILVVTIPKSNEIIEDNVKNWIKLANKNNYRGIMLDTCEKSYTGFSLYINRIKYSFISLFKPKTFDRFITEANACITHDATSELKKIKCKTLIIGGNKDKILGIDGSYKLNKLIENSNIFIYNDYSHAAYEQASDFQKRVLDFLNKKM